MKFVKKIAWFEIILFIVILSMHMYAAFADAYAFPNHWFKRDDAYYYFKVAQNISEGYGSTFDGINLTNGYHPLWMLVCIPIFALARFDLILPLRILLVVIAILHAASSILIFRLVREYLSQPVAILAASFWSFNYYIHSTVYEMGLETPITVFAVLLLIYKLSQFEKLWRRNEITKKHLAALALLSALAMFGRLDLVFFGFLVGIWVVFRGTPIRFLLPLDILIIFVSMTSSILLRTGFDIYNSTYASSALEATFISLIVKSAALYIFGIYSHPFSNSIWETIKKVLLALVTSAVILPAIYIFLSELGMGRNFPRSAFLLDFVISLILITASRLAARWFADPKRAQPENAVTQFKVNWKKWASEGALYYGILGGLLLAYMIFNHLMFGTSSPVSGQIKRWWGSMGNSAYERPAGSWSSYFGMDAGTFETLQPFSEVFWKTSEYLRPILPGADKVDERFFAAFFIFLLVSLVLIFMNKRRSVRAITMLGGIPLLAASGIQILSYTATSYGGAKEWYWISQMILLTFITSILIDLILQPIKKIKFANLAALAGALIFSAYHANSLWDAIKYIMPHGYFPTDRPYMEVVAYIEENTFPGEIIGMTGGGNVGYFIKDRTIVNMDGLINSYEYFHILQKGEAPMFLRERGMTVIFANPRLLGLPPYFSQFDRYLERYSSYGGKDLLYLLEDPKY